MQKVVKEFKVTPENDLECNGIMKYLTIINDGINIHSNKTIEITTNSIFEDNKNNHPKYLVEFGSSLCYWSDNIDDIFVCFDFKENAVQVTDYLFKSCEHDEGGSHLKNWVIEVSNDAENWTVIDDRSNDSSLNGSDNIALFHVSKKTREFYRYVRIRQTGYSWDNSLDVPDYYFALCSVEFYGKLKINNDHIVN